MARELLAERDVDAHDPAGTTCPACGRVLEVEVGDLESRTGWIGFLFFGIGHQPTWFTPRTTRKSEIVMRPRAPRTAFRCRACGLLMFASREG